MPWQHQRLALIDTIALWRAEFYRQHIGLLQQSLIGRQHGVVLLRLAFTWHQFQRVAGQ
ncbi:Uncharacterised protein [Pantoea agglomerans]|uniref:Uncharacterized protein n=1 Tax=Enterobacter agglomerans TaxID=549 RepID=A0A379AGT7_ENTAG|nr:Uncharacterised protein [Pantoea agglomerans]